MNNKEDIPVHPELITALDRLVAGVTARAVDAEQWHQAYTEGTLRTYYADILVDAAAELLMIPINIALIPGDHKVDPELVTEAATKVAQILAITFEISQQQAYADLLSSLGSLPAVDMRNAAIIKHRGRLN